MKDVANLVGVSVSTVSYALNSSSKVSPQMRTKIQQVANELHYHKNGAASDLKRNKTNTIVLILSDIAGPFFSEFVKGVQHVTLANGYDLVACSSLGGENSTAAKFVKEKRSEGAIVFTHNISDGLLEEAARKRFPVVVVDRTLNFENIVSVTVDNIHGGYLATEYLIQQGHREIAYVGGAINSLDNKDRYKGYQKALQEYQIQPYMKTVLSGRFNEEGGYNAAKMMMLQGSLPSAVFFANDEMAVGGMRAFAEGGVRVPDEISVIGYDDIALARYSSPPLTTIHQPKYEMGTLAAHVLFRVLAGEQTESKYQLNAEIVVRHSCKPMGGRGEV